MINKEFNVMSVAGKNIPPPVTMWTIVTPSGAEEGEYDHVADALQDLRSIPDVEDEIMARLNEVYYPAMGEQGINDWLFSNTADIAEDLGYRLKRVRK